MKKIKVEAKEENLDKVLDFIRRSAEEADCPLKIQNQICIASEEIFVNIAHYAYGDKSGEAEISLDISDMQRKFTIIFSDNGIPYDPLAKEDPDITLSAEKRQVGGLGIYIVKKSMDNVSYEYRGGKNIFTMEKCF